MFTTGRDTFEFLNQKDYDIRKNHSGRWIDQKCTPDVLSFIADCIVQYVGDQVNKGFTVKDIWFSEYSCEQVQQLFKKPSPKDPSAKSEYNKFFGQPLKLFAYAGILIESKLGNANYYKIANMEMLYYLAIREKNNITFLNKYISKVLIDSDILGNFTTFFSHPSQPEYIKLKEFFFNFIISNTAINGETECNRIFTKVLNILAFTNNNYGTERGHISRQKITLDKLMYNQDNFRDIYSNKPKEMTRNEYIIEIGYNPNNEYSKYSSAKAKRYLSQFNFDNREGKSEVKSGDYEISKATTIHHIFSEAQFPQISYYLENLIALTPSQHFNEAHENYNTGKISEDYQHVCLLSKIDTIRENLFDNTQEKIYSFNDLVFVLNTGLETEQFSEINLMDWDEAVNVINFIYSNN